MKSLGRFLEAHAEETIACVALSTIAICIFLQVITRYVFNSALQWSEEVASICMVWTVYMGASLCVRERFHIRILAGVMLLPRRFSFWSVVLADLLCMAFCVFMLIVSAQYLGTLWRFTSRTPSLGINQFYPQLILLIGYGLILARLLQVYADWWRSGRRDIPGMRDEHSAGEVEL